MSAGCSGASESPISKRIVDSGPSDVGDDETSSEEMSPEAGATVVDATIDGAIFDDATVDGGLLGDAAPNGANADGVSANDANPNDGSPTCDPDDASDGCVSLNCAAGQAVTCDVVPDETFCEFVQAAEAGAAAMLTCGQTAKVVLENCGGCGPVWVDLFYDGTQCWQSAYACTNVWVDPHVNSTAPPEADTDGSTGATEPGNGNPEGGAADAAADGSLDDAIDANACDVDASTVACCCGGGVRTDVVCNADGTPGCAGSGDSGPSYTVYYGADCTRACGPCSSECIDADDDAAAGDASTAD